ncbi:MAG: CBS domain-containing protein [Spirochaetes bacterium]|nr:CBS domain-containing protein [Spirochaetota bacterium]MCK5266869.1 CBS domain-containing protein [Spirochaetota bacterium]
MISINDILKEKGNAVISVDNSAAIDIALEKMVENNVGSVIIMDKDSVLGIFTERDYLKFVVRDKQEMTTLVKDVMTKNIVVVAPSDNIDDALAIMTEKRLRHLPVINDKKLIGIVSIGDLVKEKIRDQEATIRYLSDYIGG